MMTTTITITIPTTTTDEDDKDFLEKYVCVVFDKNDKLYKTQLPSHHPPDSSFPSFPGMTVLPQAWQIKAMNYVLLLLNGAGCTFNPPLSPLLSCGV
eukprot:5664098-Ditylum_brightwellii.AAC.1